MYESYCPIKRKMYLENDKKSRPLGNIWQSMKQRCYNKNSLRYSFYGARGIKVCDRWLNDYKAFEKDMGPRPSKKHSLDRIDVDGDYSPENCKWSLQSEQVSNRRPYSNTGEKYVYYIESQRRKYKAYCPKLFKTKSFYSLEEAISYRDTMLARVSHT